jgi:hypothetical protein
MILQNIACPSSLGCRCEMESTLQALAERLHYKKITEVVVVVVPNVMVKDLGVGRGRERHWEGQPSRRPSSPWPLLRVGIEMINLKLENRCHHQGHKREESPRQVSIPPVIPRFVGGLPSASSFDGGFSTFFFEGLTNSFWLMIGPVFRIDNLLNLLCIPSMTTQSVHSWKPLIRIYFFLQIGTED